MLGLMRPAQPTCWISLKDYVQKYAPITLRAFLPKNEALNSINAECAFLFTEVAISQKVKVGTADEDFFDKYISGRSDTFVIYILQGYWAFESVYIDFPSFFPFISVEWLADSGCVFVRKSVRESFSQYSSLITDLPFVIRILGGEFTE